jgi:DNA modification methylase
MGSGSVGVAALKLGRVFTGNDLNPEAVRVAAQRLARFGAGVAPTVERDGPRDLLDALGRQA